MVRTKLYNGCSHTPMIERPQHPTRGQFTPEASQTQAPVTFATEPARRAGGGFTDHARFHSLAQTALLRDWPSNTAPPQWREIVKQGAGPAEGDRIDGAHAYRIVALRARNQHPLRFTQFERLEGGADPMLWAPDSSVRRYRPCRDIRHHPRGDEAADASVVRPSVSAHTNDPWGRGSFSRCGPSERVQVHREGICAGFAPRRLGCPATSRAPHHCAHQAATTPSVRGSVPPAYTPESRRWMI